MHWILRSKPRCRESGSLVLVAPASFYTPVTATVGRSGSGVTRALIELTKNQKMTMSNWKVNVCFVANGDIRAASRNGGSRRKPDLRHQARISQTCALLFEGASLFKIDELTFPEKIISYLI
jgi:hypothetical protein